MNIEKINRPGPDVDSWTVDFTFEGQRQLEVPVTGLKVHVAFDFYALQREMDLAEKKAVVEDELIKCVRTNTYDRVAELVTRGRDLIRNEIMAPHAGQNPASFEPSKAWRVDAAAYLDELIKEVIVEAHKYAKSGEYRANGGQ